MRARVIGCGSLLRTATPPRIVFTCTASDTALARTECGRWARAAMMGAVRMRFAQARPGPTRSTSMTTWSAPGRSMTTIATGVPTSTAVYSEGWLSSPKMSTSNCLASNCHPISQIACRRLWSNWTRNQAARIDLTSELIRTRFRKSLCRSFQFSTRSRMQSQLRKS